MDTLPGVQLLVDSLGEIVCGIGERAFVGPSLTPYYRTMPQMGQADYFAGPKARYGTRRSNRYSLSDA